MLFIKISLRKNLGSTIIEKFPMILAADAFWKWPNVFDTITTVGLFIGIVSIWVSWCLASRDIHRRLEEAADRAAAVSRDEVRRIAQTILYSEIGATIQRLSLAREACTNKKWDRAILYCSFGREQLSQLLERLILSHPLRQTVQPIVASLQDCVTKLRSQPANGTGKVPDSVATALDDNIASLLGVEAHLTQIRIEE